LPFEAASQEPESNQVSENEGIERNKRVYLLSSSKGCSNSFGGVIHAAMVNILLTEPHLIASAINFPPYSVCNSIP
jgi:hypothetical protein